MGEVFTILPWMTICSIGYPTNCFVGILSTNDADTPDHALAVISHLDPQCD